VPSPEAGIGGEDGDLVERADPGDQFVHVRSVGEGHLLPAQGRDPDHWPAPAAFAPGGLGLGEQVQRGHEDEHTAGAKLFGAASGDEGLAGSGRHDHLSAEPPLGHSRSCRQFECLEYRVHGFPLVGTEFLHHHSGLPSHASWTKGRTPHDARTPLKTPQDGPRPLHRDPRSTFLIYNGRSHAESS
jgi:hypothetical protein